MNSIGQRFSYQRMATRGLLSLSSTGQKQTALKQLLQRTEKKILDRQEKSIID
jgi:hypothetical protein